MRRAVPLALLLAGCAVNPVTGKRELSFISEAQEIQMGRQLLAQSAQESGFYDNPALEKYVADIGLEMAKTSERPNLPWEFHVLDDAVVNAYAAPGGFIFITRGILAYMNSEAELAGVIGHEIGHVTAKHSVAQLSKQQAMGGALILGAILAPEAAGGIAGQAAMGFSQLLLLKYGRDDESQSDQLGHRYSLRAGYDVREMSNTFLTLQRVSGGAGNGMPALLSSHPDPGDRAEATKRWADTVSSYAGLVSGRDRFLQMLDGLVVGEDPRNGYFEGTRFLHPTLKFQFDIPTGWRTANQAARVVAMEPQGAAQLELTQAKEASPQAAAQAFSAQQGLQVGRSSGTTVNGLPAWSVAFRAQLQQGQVVDGEAMFLQHGGSVYRYTALSVSTATATLGSALGQSLRSFRTTPANQTWKRVREIDVIRLSRAMTVDALAQQSGGATTAAELAIINSVEAGQMLPSGRLVKTIRFR